MCACVLVTAGQRAHHRQAVGMARAGVLLLTALSVQGAFAKKGPPEHCRELGFTDALLCSQCDKLTEFVPKGDKLVNECRGCCQEDVTDSATYTKVVLEVCQ
jgi:hypothetical protein